MLPPFAPSLQTSDEEDDVVGYHDLVIILHASEGGADLGFIKGGGTGLVDAFLQSVHAHRLSVCRAEDLQQRSFELFQPGNMSKLYS